MVRDMNYAHIDALAIQAGAGNPLAFQELLAAFSPKISALAARTPAGDDAQDCAQDLAIALWLCVRRYDAARGVPFAAFAARYLEVEFQKRLRGRERRYRYCKPAADLSLDAPMTDDGETLAALLQDGRATAEENLILREEAVEGRRKLQRHLSRLPPGQRQILMARYGEGLSVAAIAARFGVSVNTVKTQLKRALAVLRKNF